MKHTLSAQKSLTPGVYMTCWETYANGLKICTRGTSMATAPSWIQRGHRCESGAHPVTALHNNKADCRRGGVLVGGAGLGNFRWCAVVHGTTRRISCVFPRDTTTTALP